MRLAILPNNKCYSRISSDADMIAIRWMSQIGDKGFDRSKTVFVDQFCDRDEAERLNHQAVADCLDLEMTARGAFSYKGISVVDIDIRQIWSKAFVQVYRETLNILSCIKQLKVKVVVAEKGDPWLFLLKKVLPQAGVAIETVDGLGVEDGRLSQLLREEFPTVFTIDFHPVRGTGWKVRAYTFAVNILSSVVRLVKGKRPFVMFSLYKPLEPLKQALLSDKKYYPLLHQINQMSFWGMVFGGVKLFSFDYKCGPDQKASGIAERYKVFLREFFKERHFVETGGLKVSADGALLSVIEGTVTASFCQIIRNMDVLDRLFSSSDIKGYLGFCDSPWEERSLVRMCQKYKVPNAIVINGVLSNSFYIEAKTADHVFVYGENQKKDYLKDHPEKAIVAGNPLYEKAFAKRSRKTVNHPPKKILIGTSDPVPGDINCQYSSTEVFLKNVMGALGALKGKYGFEVSLKLHPGESRGFYERFVKEEGFDVADIINSGDMQEILMGYDLLIINHSVAVFEASLIGIPVLYHHPARQVMQEPFGGGTSLVSAFNTTELRAALEKIFSDKAAAFGFTSEKELTYFTGPLDGTAGSGIKKYLNGLFGGKKR